MTPAFESVCYNTLRNLDAFIDRELDAPTTMAVQRHVSECAACSRELDLRTNLRNRLRNAARDTQPAAFLETRIRANVRTHEPRSPRWMQRSAWLTAVATMLAVAVGLSVTYQLGHLRLTVASQNRYIDSLLQKVSLAMAPGLSDHVHCAVFRKYPKQAPAVETLRSELAPEYRPLLDIVRRNVPDGFSVHMAHECTFRGRKFVHIALKSDSNLMSLVLTRRRPGETLSENGIAPIVSRGGVNLYGASAQRFQVSGFETREHFAYLVSDIGAAENHRLMLAMGPEVRALLSKLRA